MKQYTIILFVIFLIVTNQEVLCSTSNNLSFKIKKLSQTNIFKCEVMINSAPNQVEKMNFSILYNSKTVKYSGNYTPGYIIDSKTKLFVVEKEPGQIEITGVTMRDFFINKNFKGVLLELEFETLSENQNCLLEFKNLNGDILNWSANNGSCCEQYSIKIQTQSNSAGSNICVNVSIPSAPTIVEAFIFEITYDPDILEYTNEYNKGILVDNFTQFEVNKIQPGLIRVGGIAVNNNYIRQGSEGSLVNLLFLIKDCKESKIRILNLKDDMAGWNCMDEVFKCDGKSTLQLSHLCAKPGDQANFIISTQNTPKQIEKFSFHLLYDCNILEYIGFERGMLTDHFDFLIDKQVSCGNILFSGFVKDGSGIKKGMNGILIKSIFKVKENIESELYFSNIVGDIEDWSFDNGELNPQYLSEIFKPENNSLKVDQRADINKNGSIGLDDLIIMLKLLCKVII